MFNGVSRGLCFKRIGVFGDGSILACAREENTNKIRLFLITKNGEKCYFKSGAKHCWRSIGRDGIEKTLQSICLAIAHGLEVFEIHRESANIINDSSSKKEGNMFTHLFRIVVSATLIASMVVPAYAASLHIGQRQRANIMPASRMHPVRVSSDKAHVGRTDLTKNEDRISKTDKMVTHPGVADAAVADETGSNLPDEARVRMYDADGNFIGWQEVDIVRDDAGRIIKKTTVTFDKDGKRINSSTRTFEYTLDDRGNVASVKVTHKKDGKVVWTAEHTFTRDENGNVTERTATFKDANGKVMFTAVQTYTRDDNGRITESTIERKDAKGNLLSKDRITFTYAEDGSIKERTLTRTNAQGKTIFESTKTFKNGVIQKEIRKRFGNNGNLVRSEIVNYH